MYQSKEDCAHDARVRQYCTYLWIWQYNDMIIIQDFNNAIVLNLNFQHHQLNQVLNTQYKHIKQTQAANTLYAQVGVHASQRSNIFQSNCQSAIHIFIVIMIALIVTIRWTRVMRIKVRVWWFSRLCQCWCWWQLWGTKTSLLVQSHSLERNSPINLHKKRENIKAMMMIMILILMTTAL